MHREDSFDSDTEADFADRECLTYPAAASSDDDALKGLDTFAPSLDDPDIDPNRVAGAKLRNVIAQICRLDLIESVQESSKDALRQERIGSLDTAPATR